MRRALLLTLAALTAGPALCLDPGVYLYTVADGTVRRLCGGGDPVWSPDGSHLLLHACQGSETRGELNAGDMYTILPDGSGKTRLSTTGPTMLYQLAAYSGDGPYIAAAGYNHQAKGWATALLGEMKPIQVVVFDGLGGLVRGPLTVSYPCEEPLSIWGRFAWRPTGHELVTKQVGGQPLLLDVESGSRTRLAGTESMGNDDMWPVFVWSLDGRTLAYQRQRSIYLYQVDAAAAAPTPVEGRVVGAGHDGTSVPVSTPGGNRDTVHRLSATGARLSTTGEVCEPGFECAVSTRGSLMAWYGSAEGTDGAGLCVGGPGLDPRLAVRLNLADTQGTMSPPSISPDGRLVAFGVPKRLPG